MKKQTVKENIHKAPVEARGVKEDKSQQNSAFVLTVCNKKKTINMHGCVHIIIHIWPTQHYI